MGSMTTIINENADQMPHQMWGIGHGRMDTLKFLSAGNNWKRVQVDANEVIPVIFLSSIKIAYPSQDLDRFRCLHSQ
jgi:hypothetical protein